MSKVPDEANENTSNTAKIFAAGERVNIRLNTSPTNGDAKRRKKTTYLALFPGQKCQIAMFGIMRST